MRTLRSKPSRTSLIAFGLFLLPFAYVLSYAPVVRISGRSPLDDDLAAYYGAVDWLLDRTPLYEPHLKWAGLWGVEEEFDAGQLLFRTYFVETADRVEVINALTAERTVINDESRNVGIHILAPPVQRQARAFIERREVLAETAESKSRTDRRFRGGAQSAGSRPPLAGATVHSRRPIDHHARNGSEPTAGETDHAARTHQFRVGPGRSRHRLGHRQNEGTGFRLNRHLH